MSSEEEKYAPCRQCNHGHRIDEETGEPENDCPNKHEPGILCECHGYLAPKPAEPKKVRHIVGRIRHEATARALYAYMRERFNHVFEYEYSEGEKWWLMMAVTWEDDPSGTDLSLDVSSQMCEACRAFSAGRQSMVD